MPYIKKTDDKLEVIEIIPSSYGMISNYNLLDIDTHNKDGFFKLDSSEPLLNDDEEFAIVPDEYEFTDADKTYRRKYVITKKPNVNQEAIAPLPKSTEELKIQALIERNRRLTMCDWVELPSVIARMDSEVHARWLDYRDRLRKCVDVDDYRYIVWPVAPYSPMLGPEYPHGHLNP
jgi:hypothetical protein